MRSSKRSVSSLNLKLDRTQTTPLYLQIESQVQAQITSGELTPGSVLPPIRDLAAEMNLSYVTVQQAFAALARAGAVQRIRGQGTVVLDAAKLGAIGIYCCYSVFDVDSPPVCRHAVSTALRWLKQRDLPHRIYLGDEASEGGRVIDDMVADLQAGRLSGLLAIECTPFLQPAIEEAHRRSIPVVALHKPAGQLTNLWVHIDADDFIVRGIEYLAGQGCPRIAVAYTLNAIATPDRGGIERLVAEAGLENYVVSITGHPCTRLGGYAAMAALKDQEINGLVVLDEFMASGVEQYLIEQAVDVPASLAVVTQWSPNSGVHFVLPFVRYETDTSEWVIEAMDLLHTAASGAVVDEPQRSLRLRRIDCLNGHFKGVGVRQQENA